MIINVVNITAAGGVICNKTHNQIRVLLIKRKGFWDLPKGKLEEGESIEECAVREVEEETGVINVSIEDFLCETYHEYFEDETKYGKTTHWYSMKTGNPDFGFDPQAEEGITEMKWIDLAKAKSMVHFENLVTVLEKVG